MRKISAGVGLVAAPTLIAGVYGMNFEHMPELGWQFGYPFALLLMVATSVGAVDRLQEVRLALSRAQAVSTPVASRTSVSDAERDPVEHERQVGVRRDVAQQPGDRGVPDDERDHRRHDRRAPAVRRCRRAGSP